MERAYLPAELHDRDWLVAQLEAGATVDEIAALCGVDERRVNRALRSFGLKWVRVPRQLLDVEWLAEQHATKTGKQIAAELGVTDKTVTAYLRRAGLRPGPRR